MLFADLIDFESLVPLAIFGLFAAGVWWFLDLVAAGNNRATDRLDDYKDPSRRKRDLDKLPLKKSDKMAKVLANTAPALAAPLVPKNEFEQSKLKTKLANGGFRGETAASVFLGLKFAGLVGGFFFGGGIMVAVSGMSQESLYGSTIIAGVCFYLPSVVLWFITKQRKDSIFMSLPDALDLLVVCVESGLGLDQAMRKVSEEMKSTARIISEEFALCNFQLQMGRSRADALHELGVRTGVDDLRALAAILIQADKFGSSIAQALRVQSDSMRTRRRQLAEERAAKTAVKLIFPLVIFIFPGIFVVLVGPAAITMTREMFPVMQGS